MLGTDCGLVIPWTWIKPITDDKMLIEFYEYAEYDAECGPQYGCPRP
jgi:hypothetical protein